MGLRCAGRRDQGQLELFGLPGGTARAGRSSAKSRGRVLVRNRRPRLPSARVSGGGKARPVEARAAGTRAVQ